MPWLLYLSWVQVGSSLGALSIHYTALWQSLLPWPLNHEDSAVSSRPLQPKKPHKASLTFLASLAYLAYVAFVASLAFLALLAS